MEGAGVLTLLSMELSTQFSEDAAENAMAGLYTEIDKANRWMDRLEPLLKNPKRDPITIVCISIF